MASDNSFAASVARKEGISVQLLPQRVEIVDCEKKRGRTRYYAYVIEVTRKDKSKYYIFRRYRQFDKMVTRLEERFPIEAGSLRASDRTLPTLPGKKYLGRSAIRDVADERLPLLNDFLKKLYLMSDKIRYDSIVVGFLKTKPDDINNPYTGKVAYPSSYPATSPSRSPVPQRTKSSQPPKPRPPRPQIPLPHPHQSIPPEKPPPPRSSASHKVPNPPSMPPPPKPASIPAISYPAQSRPAPPTAGKGPRAKVRYNYDGRYSDELDLTEGSTIVLLKRVDGDWYEGKFRGKTGLVPSNYLDIIEPLPADVEEDESSEDEWDDENGKIQCYHKGRIVTIEVDIELIRRPVFHKLQLAVRSELRDSKAVLNYKDRVGDLIEIVDTSDLQLMQDNHQKAGTKAEPHSSTAPWILYISREGSVNIYHTNPYKPPAPLK